jgi:uncharacterized protein YdhG (YjbR/CyaY superfamily)
MAKTDFKSVTEYIASKPKDVQVILKRVRSTIRKALPAAEEVISYQIPVYKLNGVPALYFAGWKQHAAFKDELARHELSKGTIRFPLSEPVPVNLIERIAKFRAEQLTMREKGKRGRKKGREMQLERVRRICGTMPSVTEKLSHGAPTFFVERDKSVFTMFVAWDQLANNRVDTRYLERLSSSYRQRQNSTFVKRGANCGFNQTQPTSNGRRGGGSSCCAARVRGTRDWGRRSCHAVLRKGPCSHPL